MEIRPWSMDNADDEAPKDPGAHQANHQSYTEKDFEGHRAHTVYFGVGVHLPGERRHSHRRHHKHPRSKSVDSKGDDDVSIPTIITGEEDPKPRQVLRNRLGRLSFSEEGESCTPPAQRVQFILGEDVDDGTHESHPLFSEMEELVKEGDEMEWKETARWIKFEEDVEEGGNRWSKPHVATLSLHSLFELRSLLLNGTVILDMEASSLEQISDLVLDNMVNAGSLNLETKDKVREALLRRHRHQHERRKDNNVSRLPIIRSLAEIGRNHSSSKNLQRKRGDSVVSLKQIPQGPYNTNGADNNCNKEPPLPQTITRTIDDHGHYVPVPVEDNTQTASTLGPPPSYGSINKPSTEFGKFLSVPGQGTDKTDMSKSPSSVSISRNHSTGDLNGDYHRSNLQFMRKIPQGAEASNILVGEVDFLDKPLSAFIRLNQAAIMGDLTEVPVPTRFLFVLLGPIGGIAGFHEIGRAMATLMSDEVFHEVAYKARNRVHLLAGVDEFLDAVTVLPPGEWDPTIRIEPPASIPPQDTRKRPPEKPKDEMPDEEEEHKIREESGLTRTGRLFGGLVNDLKRKVPWYWSDFKDALAIQCVASWIFLYFACLSPIITFGGLLSEATGKNMAAMESLVSGFVCGLGYGFFSGQPLTILGSTGPVLVFETIVYEFCKSVHWDYMAFRFWIGVWIAIILMILVAIDASALVCYITRFTEENFACLIAFIFIYKAVENVLSIGKKNPINSTGLTNLSYDCRCIPPDDQPYLNNFEYYNSVNWSVLDTSSCLKNNGTLIGDGCFTPHYVPDVFLMSIVLFLGTFLLSVVLKDFKNSLFFPSKIRQIVSDFAVIIAIFSMTILDVYSGIRTPKLEVPEEFKPTLSTRGWLIMPFNGNPIYTAPLAIVPALLGTILIFMDQQITTVIINRKENKLKKGCGYHLDLFVLSILIMVCSVMGLPWFVAATVLSINHVNSLKVESECAAPGEKPQFLGVREQRATHILIFLTIGLSVFLTPVLRYIPMPVLFGVFLYMGVASLKGLQFFDRLLIMLMPNKYQPDYMFLRQVPIKRVHMFTLIQLTCLICLWVIKSFSATSILFPLMLVVMIGIRKSLDFIFTQREMKILDDIMPEITRRKAADEINKLEDAEGQTTPKKEDINYTPSGNIQIPLANGNIMKIPLASINISEEVNKTGIWKQVNSNGKEKKKSPKNNVPKVKKNGMKTNDKKDDKRLSTMAEEEEDEGLTIKCDPKDYWSSKKDKDEKGDETAV